jgi:transposase
VIPKQLEERIVRLHFVEKWPVGTIARQVGVHHTTVKRVLHQKGVGAPTTSRPSMVEPFLPFIHETLKAYPDLPASRLHAMVAERGYPGSQSHFRRLVATLRPRKPAEAFQRLSTLSGEEAQVDWGSFGTVQVGAATRRLSAFVMVLSWSRMASVHFFYDQRMGSFLEGHVRSFDALGGVPRRVLYDNLKSAVLERRDDAIRFHPTLLELAAHYRYEPRPVAVARGNEKGRVERFIRYLRTTFWPARTFDDIDDLNRQVDLWCRRVAGARAHREEPELSVAEAWERETGKLLPLPDDPFPAEEVVMVRVGKTPYVRFDRNDYSVPHDKVRRQLEVRATSQRVRVLEGPAVVAEHVRTFGARQQVEDPAHLEALRAQKQRARQARGMDRLRHEAPSSATLLEGAARRGHNLGSATAALCRLLDSWGADALEQAIVEAIEADTLHVAAVRQVLDRKAQDLDQPPPVPVRLPDDDRVRDLHVQPHALDGYDQAGGA